MKMKFTNVLLCAMMAMAVAVSFSSCKKDKGTGDDPGPKPGEDTTYALTVSVDTLIFAEATEASMEFVATAARAGWTLVKSEGMDWVTVTPEVGEVGATTVTVKVAANSAEMPRVGYLVLTQKTSGTTARVGISQQGVVKVYDRATDSAALIALYKATNGKTWGKNGPEEGDGKTWMGGSSTGVQGGRIGGSRVGEVIIDGIPWKLTDPITKWGGVTTEVLDGQVRVTGLNLDFPSGMMGKGIPAQLFNLRQLKTLILNCALIENSDLPTEIVLLKKLETLTLNTATTINWEVPGTISMMENLREINFILGSISVESMAKFYNLPKLEVLHVESGALKGAMLPGISKLKTLKSFVIRTSSNVTVLPEDIGNLPELIVFDIAGCKKVTTIPTTVNWTNLESFVIASTGVTMIPNNMREMTKLQIFDAEQRGIEGYNMDEVFTNMPDLVKISVDGCKFTGTLNWMKGKTKLVSVQLDDNLLSGDLNLTENFSSPVLEYFKIGGCTELTGTLDGISNAKAMWAFLMTGTKVAGEIPAEIGMNKALNMILINDNQLVGGIPNELIVGRNINAINISQNNLSGVISDEVLAVMNGKTYFPDNICPQRGVGFTNCSN